MADKLASLSRLSSKLKNSKKPNTYTTKTHQSVLGEKIIEKTSIQLNAENFDPSIPPGVAIHKPT